MSSRASRRLAASAVGIALALGSGFYFFQRPPDDADRSSSAGIDLVGMESRAEGDEEERLVNDVDDKRERFIPIPRRYQFAGIERVRAADSTDELLGHYSTDEQTRVQAYYSGFGEGTFNLTDQAIKSIFSFWTKDQLEWLVSRGFPTPDEVLAADSMSDEDLAALAESGNLKAMAFHLDRLAKAQRSRMEENSGALPDLSFAPAVQERAQLEERLLGSGSPFGAYALARDALAEGDRGAAMAAYTFADRLGDVRARNFASQLESAGPVRAREALNEFIRIQTRAHRQNPQLTDPRYLATQSEFPMWR